MSLQCLSFFFWGKDSSFFLDLLEICARLFVMCYILKIEGEHPYQVFIIH